MQEGESGGCNSTCDPPTSPSYIWMQKPMSGQPRNEQKAPNSHLAHVPTEQTIKDGDGTAPQ